MEQQEGELSLWLYEEEQVLVVERKVLEQAGMFQGITFEVERYLRKLFVGGVPRFMPRSRAEADPTHKQLIPYVMMAHKGKYWPATGRIDGVYGDRNLVCSCTPIEELAING